MKIYLDVCCLNRPFDDQQQVRIRSEAEAVRLILRRVDRDRWTHVSSEMAIIEINAIADAERRRKILAMLPPSRDIMPLSDLLFARAAKLQLLGFNGADTVHIAAAEAHGCDVLLSCDDRLIKAWRREHSKMRVKIANPIAWMNENDKR